MGRAPQRPARLYFRPAGADWEYANGSGPLQYGQGRAGGRRKRVACSEREPRRPSRRNGISCSGKVARSVACKSICFSCARRFAFSKAGEFANCINISRGCVRFTVTATIGSTCWSQRSITGQSCARSFAYKSIRLYSDCRFASSKASELSYRIDISYCSGGRSAPCVTARGRRITGGRSARRESWRSVRKSRSESGWREIKNGRATAIFSRLASSTSLFAAQHLNRFEHAGLSFSL
jgi:hypothetical protein